MMPITVTTRPDEATRTPNSACAWVAETMVEDASMLLALGMEFLTSWRGS
jgi:hypothetical protein